MMPDTTAPEPLIDPDCRDGKCDSCVGGPCEHDCHRVSERTPQDDMIQVVMTPAIRTSFEDWLASHRLELFRMPDSPGDLPTYGITFKGVVGDFGHR